MKKARSILLVLALVLALLPVFPAFAADVYINIDNPTVHPEGETVSMRIDPSTTQSGRGDEIIHYYKFTMPQDGYAVFDLEYTGTSNSYIVMNFGLVAPSGNSSYFDGQNPGETTQVIARLQAGTYEYKVRGHEPGKNYPNDYHSANITWHYQASKSDSSYSYTPTEQEPNDTYENALALLPNTTAYGFIGAPDVDATVDSYDIYKFSLDVKSEVVLQGVGIETGFYSWIADKDDADWTVDSLNTRSAGNVDSKAYTLEAGDYRIAVYYSIASMDPTPYQIKYTVTPLETEAPVVTPSNMKTGTFGNSDYNSSLTLSSDGSFKMVVNFGEGFADVTGTWTASGSKLYLTIPNPPTNISVDAAYTLGVSSDQNTLTLESGHLGLMDNGQSFTYGTETDSTTIPPSLLPNNTSDWAVDEVNKAYEMDLIPDSLLDPSVDYTMPITREEFAGIAVKTYESLGNTTALPNVVSPFTDTNNLDVLKAYNTGLMVGTSSTTFQPSALLTREQAATALTRVFKRATIIGWTFETDSSYPLSYTRPAPFADDADISSWAKDSVYFMVANDIINGVGGNRFAPRATTNAQEAQNYATATREQALAIAVRMVENLG